MARLVERGIPATEFEVFEAFELGPVLGVMIEITRGGDSPWRHAGRLSLVNGEVGPEDVDRLEGHFRSWARGRIDNLRSPLCHGITQNLVAHYGEDRVIAMLESIAA